MKLSQMIRTFLIISIFMPVVYSCDAGTDASPKIISGSTLAISSPKAADHSPFNLLLQKYVSASGKVDYTGFKKSEGQLDAYLKSLSTNVPSSKTAKNESLAFWINAYNAFTIKLILKNSTVKSIQDINTGKPWDLKWISLGDKMYTLNDIENVIIRPTFKEPRIHFALNCAAKSCPPLANTAFTAQNLETMLESRTKTFINSDKNKLQKKTASVSKIFDWYKADFGNVVTFINKYANKKLDANAKLEFANYDWSLNN